MPWTNPTVNMIGKNPQLAIYGHLLALVGGTIAAISGILGLFSGNVVGGIIGVLVAIFVVVIELGEFTIEQLNDPLIRGISWIILAIVSISGFWWAGLAVGIGGLLYIFYHYE